MSEAALLQLGHQAVQMALLLAAPLLLATLVVGILVSLIQVATSIQDATLTFVPKIVAVALALLLIGNWMTRTLLEFTARVLAGVAGAAG
jgi:flagellar biosynthetic protein FliQ